VRYGVYDPYPPYSQGGAVSYGAGVEGGGDYMMPPRNEKDPAMLGPEVGWNPALWSVTGPPGYVEEAAAAGGSDGLHRSGAPPSMGVFGAVGEGGEETGETLDSFVRY